MELDKLSIVGENRDELATDNAIAIVCQPRRMMIL
jgi:hypothetical protein